MLAAAYAARPDRFVAGPAPCRRTLCGGLDQPPSRRQSSGWRRGTGGRRWCQKGGIAKLICEMSQSRGRFRRPGRLEAPMSGRDRGEQGGGRSGTGNPWGPSAECFARGRPRDPTHGHRVRTATRPVGRRGTGREDGSAPPAGVGAPGLGRHRPRAHCLEEATLEARRRRGQPGLHLQRAPRRIPLRRGRWVSAAVAASTGPCGDSVGRGSVTTTMLPAHRRRPMALRGVD